MNEQQLQRYRNRRLEFERSKARNQRRVDNHLDCRTQLGLGIDSMSAYLGTKILEKDFNEMRDNDFERQMRGSVANDWQLIEDNSIPLKSYTRRELRTKYRPPDLLTIVGQTEWAYNLVVSPIILFIAVLNWIVIPVSDWIYDPIEEKLTPIIRWIVNHWTIAQSYNDLIREKPNPIFRDADYCSCGPEYRHQ